LKNLKKLFLSCSFLATFLVAGDGINQLSSSKQEQINLSKDIDKKNATNLRYDWINPIIASYSYFKSDQYSKENTAKYFRISIDQPIFKSGGIYFAIKYSNASEEFTQVSTSLKEQSLISSLYESVLNLKKLDFQIEKLKYLIENKKIDIIRKREQFDNGLLDSSFLDSAILAKSTTSQQLLDLKQREFVLLQEFKNLSDKDYRDINLPKFELVSKDEFISKNLDLFGVKSKSKQMQYLKNMTISNYLPTISLFGEYNNREDSFRMFKQNNESTNYGLRVSMPIFDINIIRNIQIRKLEYIKSKLEIEDKRRELIHMFETIIHTIDILKQREAIANEDVRLYSSLLSSTKESLLAGEKTKSDVEMMKNSKAISFADSQIYEIDIQLEFLKLYTKMSDAI